MNYLQKDWSRRVHLPLLQPSARAKNSVPKARTCHLHQMGWYWHKGLMSVPFGLTGNTKAYTRHQIAFEFRSLLVSSGSLIIMDNGQSNQKFIQSSQAVEFTCSPAVKARDRKVQTKCKLHLAEDISGKDLANCSFSLAIYESNSIFSELELADSFPAWQVCSSWLMSWADCYRRKEHSRVLSTARSDTMFLKAMAISGRGLW